MANVNVRIPYVNLLIIMDYSQLVKNVADMNKQLYDDWNHCKTTKNTICWSIKDMTYNVFGYSCNDLDSSNIGWDLSKYSEPLQLEIFPNIAETSNGKVPVTDISYNYEVDILNMRVG